MGILSFNDHVCRQCQHQCQCHCLKTVLRILVVFSCSCAHRRSSQPKGPLRLVLPGNLAPLLLSPVWPQHLSFKFLRTRSPEEGLPSSGSISPTIRTVTLTPPPMRLNPLIYFSETWAVKLRACQPHESRCERANSYHSRFSPSWVRAMCFCFVAMVLMACLKRLLYSRGRTTSLRTVTYPI